MAGLQASSEISTQSLTKCGQQTDRHIDIINPKARIALQSGKKINMLDISPICGTSIFQ